jgi:hypothetical protein
MDTAVRRGAVFVLLVISASCGGSTPASPTPADQPLSTFIIPPPPPFPPLSGPSRTFVFDRELSYPVSDYTKKSQFVLYDNGAFSLQYPSIGGGGYRGGYKDADGTIAFGWEDWSAAGAWGATGTLRGPTLTVRYNTIMTYTDFEDAVYVLVR